MSKQLRLISPYAMLSLFEYCSQNWRKLTSAEGVFSFCRTALRGCLSFAGDPSVSYMLSHIISQIFLISIDAGKFFLTETVSLEIINLLSERYGLKTAGGTGNPIQCSEKISFAVSDWTNDFSHT